MTERRERVYRFDPPDSSGAFLGLGLVQCSLIGGGLIITVALLTGGAPLPVAAVPAAGGVSASFLRVRGRVMWEWLPLLAGWVVMRLGRGRRWFAPLLLSPSDPGRSTPLPPCLSGLSVIDVPWRGRQSFGAVFDRERGTLTALLRVAGPPFVVEARADQERLLTGWGDVLSQFAAERTAVTHITWSDLVAPSGLGGHRAWLASVEPDGPHGDARASYRDLMARAAGSAAAHDTVVTITVARDRVTNRRRTAAGRDDRAASALASAIDALLRGARTAGLTAGDPLSVHELHRLLRTRVDPIGTRPAVVAGRLVERLGLVSAQDAGPVVLETEWRHIRVDAVFHRTYEVVSWPRLPVGPAWLEPFLASGGVTRAMTVLFSPVSAYQSRRKIDRDLVKLESDAATREDKGRRVDAGHRRATQALLDREQELVAGFAEMRYAALVSVCASNEGELDEHCDVVEQLAREAGMELRSLDGRQDLAWAAALPLGLAPKHLLI